MEKSQQHNCAGRAWCAFVLADLNRADETAQALAKSTGEEFGHLDVLINNAGIFAKEDGHASDVESETLRKTFATNSSFHAAAASSASGSK